MIDRLFDAMNSRNSHVKGFKAAPGPSNWKEKLEFMIEAWFYSTELTMNDDTPFYVFFFVSGKIFVDYMNMCLLVPTMLLTEKAYILTYDKVISFINARLEQQPKCGLFPVFSIIILCGIISPGNTGTARASDDTFVYQLWTLTLHPLHLKMLVVWH